MCVLVLVCVLVRVCVRVCVFLHLFRVDFLDVVKSLLKLSLFFVKDTNLILQEEKILFVIKASVLVCVCPCVCPCVCVWREGRPVSVISGHGEVHTAGLFVAKW